MWSTENKSLWTLNTKANRKESHQILGQHLVNSIVKAPDPHLIKGKGKTYLKNNLNQGTLGEPWHNFRAEKWVSVVYRTGSAFLSLSTFSTSKFTFQVCGAHASKGGWKQTLQLAACRSPMNPTHLSPFAKQNSWDSRDEILGYLLQEPCWLCKPVSLCV